MYSSEENQWPARTVSSSQGRILFESSWVDTTRVWRISVLSPEIRTSSGYRVGMRLDSLARAGTPLSVESEEGVFVVELSRDSVAATLDAASQNALVALSVAGRLASNVTPADLPAGSRIGELIVSKDCRTSR